MPAEWEQYESRYRLRHETYEAYVDVWVRLPEALSRFSGWASFSQAVSAEPKQRDRPERVRAAEELMRAGGYQIDSPTASGASRWEKVSRS